MFLPVPEEVGNSTTDITVPVVKIVSESNKLYQRFLEKYLINYTIKYSTHTARLLTLSKMLIVSEVGLKTCLKIKLQRWLLVSYRVLPTYRQHNYLKFWKHMSEERDTTGGLVVSQICDQAQEDEANEQETLSATQTSNTMNITNICNNFCSEREAL